MRRVLVDECINPRMALLLRSALPECIVETVRDLGWVGQKDWVLIRQIQHRFDVFVTIDKGIEFEHNLRRLSFGIVVVTAANNQIPSYQRAMEQLIQGIERVAPGSVIHVSDPELGED